MVGQLFARPRLTLLVVGLVVGLNGIANHELWTPDEPRVAGIGREMWESGDWTVPHLSGEAFLEKPPLYWWAQASVFSAAGTTSSGLARIPSALFCALALGATFALGRRFFSSQAALLGSLTLLTTYRFLNVSHWVIVDAALVAATTLALAAWVHADGRKGPGRVALLLLFYASLAAGFLAKGPVGVGLPAITVGVWALWTGRLRTIFGFHLVWGTALVVATSGLWLWQLHAAAGPDGLESFLVGNQLGRFAPGAVGYDGGHTRPWFYYLRQLPADLLPWTPLTLLACVGMRRALPSLDRHEADGLRFLVAASLPAVILLSFAGTKRGLYLLPLLPAFALLVGWWMTHPPQGPLWERRVAHAWAAILVVLGALLAVLAGFVDASFWAASVAGAVVYAAAAYALRNVFRRPRPEAWLATALLLALGAALALAAAAPANERNKNMRPLLEVVNREVPTGETLHLFHPTETTRGYVAFYTGRRPLIVEDLAELRALARPEAPIWTVIEGKRERGDIARVIEAGIPFREVARHKSGSGRVLVLARVGAE
jgi:4-amino-4-deoxy-L-arabinose transferase-like glycosyltransferase